LNRPKWGLMQFLRASKQAEVNAKFPVQRLGIIADNVKPTAFCRSFRSEGTDDYVAPVTNPASYLANVRDTVCLRG